MTNRTLQAVAVLLSMISIVAVLLGGKFIMRKMDTIAAQQYGGAENYKIAQQLFASAGFKSTQKTNLEAAMSSMNAAAGGDTATTPGTTTPNAGATNTTGTTSNSKFPGGKLTQEQLAAIKKDAYVEGDANAKVTILEYSDPECPFCVRQHTDKTIANTIAAIGADKVNHIYKVVEGVNHANTEFKSLAILCAGKLGGTDGYVGMYNKILGASTTSIMVPNTQIATFATELGLKDADLQNCITNGDTKAIYANNWTEFRGLAGLVGQGAGTPGNIIVNNETGEWQLIAGAYPTTDFQDVINQMVAAK